MPSSPSPAPSPPRRAGHGTATHPSPRSRSTTHCVTTAPAADASTATGLLSDPQYLLPIPDVQCSTSPNQLRSCAPTPPRTPFPDRLSLWGHPGPCPFHALQYTPGSPAPRLSARTPGGSTGLAPRDSARCSRLSYLRGSPHCP